MLGYYGNDEGTAATIEPDGWLHTGDVATMGEDGYFTIVDRMKDMILLKPATAGTREELITHCRQHLAGYKVPRAIQFATQLPMTSSGKIMRRLLTDIDDGTRTTASELTHAVT
jgi:long-chain acyl-CoA synthetase